MYRIQALDSTMTIKVSYDFATWNMVQVPVASAASRSLSESWNLSSQPN